jgi:hypothetical protein
MLGDVVFAGQTVLAELPGTVAHLAAGSR